MIFGIGTDIIEVERIAKQIDSNAFMKRVFTDHEIEYSMPKATKAQNLAARFAVKEAFFKALGTGMRDGMAFCDIEVVNNELGKPSIKLYGKTEKYLEKCNVCNIHVSLSHIEKYACAYVILETKF